MNRGGEYVAACRAALAAAGCVAEERRLPGGVWLVSGAGRDGLPFFCGRPEGREASWLQACRACGVAPPAET